MYGVYGIWNFFLFSCHGLEGWVGCHDVCRPVAASFMSIFTRTKNCAHYFKQFFVSRCARSLMLTRAICTKLCALEHTIFVTWCLCRVSASKLVPCEKAASRGCDISKNCALQRAQFLVLVKMRATLSAVGSKGTGVVELVNSGSEFEEVFKKFSNHEFWFFFIYDLLCFHFFKFFLEFFHLLEFCFIFSEIFEFHEGFKFDFSRAITIKGRS